jgi:hypothetical protein
MSDEWWEMTIGQLLELLGQGLAFKVVVLWNNQEEGEIFVNYGIEWEDAWKAHVKGWRPPPVPDDAFMTAREANEIERPIIDSPISTISHLMTGCCYGPRQQDQHIVH